MLGSQVGAKGPPGAMCPRSSHPHEQKAPVRLHELSKRHGGHEQCTHPWGPPVPGAPGDAGRQRGHGMGQAPPSPCPSCFPPVPPASARSPPAQPWAGRGETPGAAWGAPRGRGEPRGGAGRCRGAQGSSGGRRAGLPAARRPQARSPQGGSPVPTGALGAAPTPPGAGMPAARRRNRKRRPGKRKRKSPTRLRFRLPGALPRAPRGRAGRGARWRSRGRPCG